MTIQSSFISTQPHTQTRMHKLPHILSYQHTCTNYPTHCPTNTHAQTTPHTVLPTHLHKLPPTLSYQHTCTNYPTHCPTNTPAQTTPHTVLPTHLHKLPHTLSYQHTCTNYPPHCPTNTHAQTTPHTVLPTHLHSQSCSALDCAHEFYRCECCMNGHLKGSSSRDYAT